MRAALCVALVVVARLALAQPATAPPVAEPPLTVAPAAPAPLSAPPLEPLGTPAKPTPPLQPAVVEAPLPEPLDVPPPPGVEVPARPLTAEDLATIALCHQPQISAAQGQDTAAAGRTQQERSQLHPQVTLSAGYNRTVAAGNNAISGVGGPGQGTTGGAVGQGSGASLVLVGRQLLWDDGHTRATAAQARASAVAARINVDQVRQDTVWQVKLGYYTYLQSMRLIDVAAANLGDQKAHLSLAQARLNAGVGLPSDVVRAQAAVADATYQLTSARATAATNRVALALQAGLDPRTPLPVDSGAEPPVVLASLETLVEAALHNRPGVRQLRAAVEAAKWGVKVARTNNKPEVTASAGLTSFGNVLPTSQMSFLLGIGLVWSAYDSGLTAGMVKEAQGNLQTAEAQLCAQTLIVISDVSQAYVNVQAAQQKVQTAEAEVVNAREALRLAEGRYRAGAGVFLDVLDAQSALVSANTNLVNAQTGVNQAIVTLAHAVGQGIPDVTRLNK